MRSLIVTFFAFLFVWVAALPAMALNPDEKLSDPVLEDRARALSAELRCLVCQNQSIDDSDAQLARDLRLLVREQLVEGKSDSEILDYLVARYGEFVLLRPPLSMNTIGLWAFPAIMFLVGAGSVWMFYRRRKLAEVDESGLSAEELSVLEQLSSDDKTS